MEAISLDCSRLFSSAEVDDRLQAVSLLGGLDPVRMDLYRLAFGDQDWRVRKEAVRIFLSIAGVEKYTGLIIEFLHDPENAGLRNSSIEILVSLGPLVVDELSKEIDCPDPDVRKFVIDILGEIGSPECADAVLKALSDEDTNVLYAAVETLGKLTMTRAVEPLLALMEDADTGLRFTILEALAAIGQKVPISSLDRYLDDLVLRKALLDCFGRVGGVEALPYLVNGLVDPMRKVREVSLDSLARLARVHPAAVKTALQSAPDDLSLQLRGLLNGPDVDRQRGAVCLAALSGGKEMAQVLLPLLQDDRLRDDVVAAFRSEEDLFFDQLLGGDLCLDPLSRLYLVYLAGALSRQSGRPLALACLTDDDPQLRYAAVVALGKIGDEETIEPLCDLLRDGNAEIGDAAANALAALGAGHAETLVEVISLMLDGADAGLRVRLVRILGSVASPETEPALRLALKDPEPGVRCEAIRALGRAGKAASIDGLKLALNDEVVDVRRLAAEALGQFAEQEVMPSLALALEDPEPWVRAAAVRSLAPFAAETVDSLLDAMLEDPVGLVVISALETLSHRGDLHAQDSIERVLNHADDEVVKVAVELLIRLAKDAELKSLCQKLLSHARQEVRVHAIPALVRLFGKEALPLLDSRLQVEPEATVRRVLEDAINQLQRSVG